MSEEYEPPVHQWDGLKKLAVLPGVQDIISAMQKAIHSAPGTAAVTRITQSIANAQTPTTVATENNNVAAPAPQRSRRWLLRQGVKWAAISGILGGGIAAIAKNRDLIAAYLDELYPPFSSNGNSRNLVVSLLNQNDDYNVRINSAANYIGGDACVVQINMDKPDPAAAITQICSAIEEHIKALRKSDPKAVLNDLVIVTHGDTGQLWFANPRGTAVDTNTGAGFAADYYDTPIDTFTLLEALVILKDNLEPIELEHFKVIVDGKPHERTRRRRVNMPFFEDLTFCACDEAASLTPEQIARYKGAAIKLSAKVSIPYSIGFADPAGFVADIVDFNPDGTITPSPRSRPVEENKDYQQSPEFSGTPQTGGNWIPTPPSGKRNR